MSSPNTRTSRPKPSSGSVSLAASSRAFNSKMRGSRYAGHSTVEEEVELLGNHEEIDIESGDAIFGDTSKPRSPSAKAQGKRRVEWDDGAKPSSAFHTSPKSNDTKRGGESSDDEGPPQSFMIEQATRAAMDPQYAGQANAGSKRGRPLHSVEGKVLRPPKAAVTSMPPKPYEVSPERHSARDSRPQASSSSSGARQGGALYALDAREKALWNWVNVENLDGFLQEVYCYYEGNGIYSIALSRALNLL